MDRPITGFFPDEEGDWVAQLSCGHRQHVRHQPPFVERPWVTSEEGRAAFLGEMLPCAACDRLELPDAAVRFKSTPLFTKISIPRALQRQHETKAGVWGKIVVIDGTLLYEVLEPEPRIMMLDPETPGIIPPEVPHRVQWHEPAGFVQRALLLRSMFFRIDFYAVPNPSADA